MKRKGSAGNIILAVIVLVLLAGTAYFGIATYALRLAKKGTAYYGQREWQTAYEYYQKADKYTLRTSAELLENLGRCEVRLEKYDDALKSYKKLASVDKSNAKARYIAAQLYMRADDRKSASKEIEALREIGTREAEHYADLLEERGSENEVRGIFKGLFKKILPKSTVPKLFDGVIDLCEDEDLPETQETESETVQPQTDEPESETPAAEEKSEASSDSGRPAEKSEDAQPADAKESTEANPSGQTEPAEQPQTSQPAQESTESKPADTTSEKTTSTTSI